MESDCFDVFSCLYVESQPSVVTGHGSAWLKIRARLKVAARGGKAESPSKFNTAFVWDEGRQQSFLLGLMVSTGCHQHDKCVLTSI